MKDKTPAFPVHAHHRLIMYMFKNPAKWEPTPMELDRASRVFAKAGGSWVRLYQGSIDDVLLLRRIVKVGCKKGFFTQSAWRSRGKHTR